jgi:hypothetical protein
VPFLAPRWQLRTICNSNSRGSDALFWPPWVPQVHMLHRAACRQNTQTHKIKIKEKTQRCELLKNTAHLRRVLHSLDVSSPRILHFLCSCKLSQDPSLPAFLYALPESFTSRVLVCSPSILPFLCSCKLSQDPSLPAFLHALQDPSLPVFL